MGGLSNSNTPRLLKLCLIAAICSTMMMMIAVVNCHQVSAAASADYEDDADLVFDSLELANNHPRISRDVTENSSPPAEDEPWLTQTVNRLKRSINNLFSKDEKRAIKHADHHRINKQQQLRKKPHEKANRTKSKRTNKHSVNELDGRSKRQQEEAEDDYDNDDIVENGQNEDDYADEYDPEEEYTDNNDFVNGGQSPDNDDEDIMDVNSGDGGSGEVTPTEETPRTVNIYGHPRVYRFILTLGEPYLKDYNDRNSNDFRNMADRIKRAIEVLYQDVPGTQTANVISIEENRADMFKVKVTVDLDSEGYFDQEGIRRAVYDPINSNHRIDNLTVLPDNFVFREFQEQQSKCESNEIECKSGQCVIASSRCDGVMDCNDNSDETDCIPIEPDVPATTITIPTTTPEVTTTTTTPATTTTTTTEATTTTTTPEPTTTTTTTESTITETEFPDEGSGYDGCRADDTLQCADSSKVICADQKCDGIRDCDDGSDEQGCPTSSSECTQGDFKCDIQRCIPMSQRCDSTVDCQDGTDEHDCPTVCLEEEILCDENKCIPPGKKCDGVQDCQDNADEDGCPATQRCRSGETDCGNGECVPDYLLCDGRTDCSNGFDESRCSRACGINEFDCGDQCIDIDLFCDGVADCTDSRDEIGCGGCRDGEFQCISDSKCILSSLVCNQVSDCDDNSDELDCEQKKCGSGQWRCDDGTCIESYQQCDGNPNCPDGSDENECPSCRSNEFQCLDGLQCIDYNLHCDRKNDCRDGSDELNCPTEPPPVTETPRPMLNCPPDYLPCRSLDKCISRNQLCDGRVDCYDLSDETNCPGPTEGLNLRTYPDSQDQKEQQEVVFTCRDEGPIRAKIEWSRENGEPLPPGSRVNNNGRLEIPNIQVNHAGIYVCSAAGYPPNAPGARRTVDLRVIRREPRPIPNGKPSCGPYNATCPNGDCIPKHKVCDGTYDCADGSDENRCSINGCEPNEFRCDNKKCVLKTWRCDSDDDCGDGSDESNCATSPPGSLCQYHQFTCRSNNQCIPKSYHCDTERDCVDGSDEIGCSKPAISKPPPPMVTLNAGDRFEITCTAVGIPTPEIVWRLNWGHIPSKCRTTSDNGFGTLICENIQPEDQGAYSCESINLKGATFAVPDTILIVKQENVCRTGYFNVQARTESECIKCFCFGHTASCQSADLFIFQFQPPFDTLKLLGVRVDPSGVVDIRDEPIYRGPQPSLLPAGPNGVYSTIPDYGELSQPNVIPYFAMPENYHGNQLKSYGGYLKYTVRHSNRGYPTAGPSVIISGNGYILLHETSYPPAPNTNENMQVRFFEGEWLRKSAGQREAIASREEIMMVLEDVDNILIKLQYNEGNLNTTITNIEMDSAATPNTGLGPASYVEECSCPIGYSGYSCENCASGYTRHETGPWLGQCYEEPKTCPPGQYNDGRTCQVCPCPHTSPSNQFGRTCQLGSDGEVVCNCPPGYIGNRCQQCAPGYEGDPTVPGDSCRQKPPEPCDPAGSQDTRLDAYGRCRCKESVDGPTCKQCKTGNFFLNSKNPFGCIPCFCMGVSNQCSSSNWFRDQVSHVFLSSTGDFTITEDLNRDMRISQGIRLDQQSREILYSSFSSPNAYYWTLPSRYLGNKLTSYGGYLRYTLRHTPAPGGQSSRNTAADVELVSKNNINLIYFNRNQSQPSSAPQTFVVPLLEQYWQRTDGQVADREHLLMVLADLEAIYIKATYYTNTRESSLISVSLDIANERNTGSSERALEVEQCYCPVGYTGLSCEDCDVGYARTRNGLYLGACEPCSCNGFSNECDPDTGICLNCRDFTTGDYCDECLPGYSGDPLRGIPCSYQGTPPPCNCDPRGSVSNDCRNGRCSCKVNVEGNNCDRCRTGSFGLNVTNIDGCEFCFCSGVANECSESNLYIEQIPIQINEVGRGFTLTDIYHRTRISDNFDVNMFMNEISYNFLPSQRDTLYWSLPSTFTGSKIKSYGGKLEFTQRYTQRPQARYVPDKDVIINGNGVTIFWNNAEEQREHIVNSVSVPLHPSAKWYRLEQNQGVKPASREDILIALANIESILIRATQSSDTSTAYLSDITLDTAVDQYTGNQKASNVEVCRCPPGYRGTSCESCAAGYYKDLYVDQARPLGSCVRCTCNDREDSCELGSDQRVVCNCRYPYSGRNCEIDEITTTPIPDTTTTQLPATIEVTIQDHNLGIYEAGGTVRYNCSARSRIAPRTVRVLWRKDGGDLPPHAIDDNRGLLVITDLKVTDSGRYICEASDGYSIVTSSVVLNVGERREERPRIVLSQLNVDVTQGQLVEVRCAATGIPAPELSLVRLDGQRLDSRNFDNGVFRIQQAQVSDSGYYQCTATNRAGSDSARFQIVVREAVGPLIEVTITPRGFSGNAGDTVMLRCTTSETAQSVRWSKQGGDLPYDSREDTGTLIIYNTTPEATGVYVCTATSFSGTSGFGRATVSITGNDVGKYPTARVSPDRIALSQGGSAELTCTATGVPTPSVKWTKLGGELGSTTEQIGSTLRIRNARVEDRGVYVCVSTNVHGIEQASVVVEVTRLEAPRLEIYPSNSQIITAGNSAIIQCRPTAGIPSPSISWGRRDNIPLSRNTEEMSGGTLRFMQISPAEEGEYICTARNEAGTATASANIIVHTYPEIQIIPSQDVIRRNEGDTLRLQCIGTGTPQPSVVWTKYGERQVYSAESQLGTPLRETTAYQEFNRLTKNEEGLYICKAESSAGVVEKRVQLVVDTLPTRGDITGEDPTSSGSRPGFRDNEQPRPNPPPGPINPTYDEGFSAGVGSRAELRCRISHEGANNIRVNWIRSDNSSLPPEAYESSGTLYIDNVQPSAAGGYRCLGFDQYGKLLFSLDTRLTVLSPPRITLIPPRQVVHPGENAYINCSATGEQPISILWTPVGRTMPSSVYTRDGYIRFNNIQLQDAGRYLCQAQNSAGSAEAPADVIVEENVSKPAITADQRRQIAPVGTSVTLRCRAGNPDVRNSIRWFRENLPLPQNSQVNGEILYIPQVQQQDQGRYYCEISTKEGVHSDYIDLQLSARQENCRPGWWLCNNRNCIPQSQLCDTVDDCGDSSDEMDCQPRIRRGPVTPSSYPEPILYITPSESEHFTGETVDIFCQSSERGAITVWSKVSGWMLDNVQNNGGNLRINNLRQENRGVYRCEATGRQGAYHKDYTLNVIDEEVKDEPPVEIRTALRGSTVVLECKTDLEQPITYLWSQQGGSLPNYVDVYSKTIQLNDVTSADAGTYTCSTSSGQRNIDVPFILVVTGIVPYFTQAPNSYIALPTLGDSFIQFSFEISFKPENGNGLILYNGNKGNDVAGDYISLALVNSVPEFKFNLGHGTTVVKSDRPLANGEWHTVKVIRNRKKVTMYVDGQGPFIGLADGKYIGLDLTEHLYLGGVPDSRNISPEVFRYGSYVGFVGCISRFKIGHTHLDILRESIEKTGITTCETCSDNKCANQGACQEALSKEGYTCICPSGFSGPTCNKLKGEACSPYACGVGRCIDTENTFECQCPLGLAGRRCEREITINEPAFQNDAYIAYPTPKPTRRLKISLKIKPNDVADGILLYCSETEEGHGDFISIALHDKRLEFRFDAGNGVTVIRQNEELVPGKWHVVTASRSLSDGKLIVDGSSAVGRLAGNHKTLNLQTPLYIGGYNKHHVKINDGVKIYSGFNGCISDINVSGVDLNIIQNVTDASNVEDCNDYSDVDNNINTSDYVHDNNEKSMPFDSQQTGCSRNPCLNNGVCYPLTPTEYQCSCIPGFAGKNCETVQKICDQQPCQNQGFCRGNNTHYSCDCVLGYSGYNCEQITEIRNDVHFDGNGYLEFSRDLLNHEKQEAEIIALEISTNTSNGLIFWHGQSPNEDGQGQDYISLALVNGYLEYSFDLGMGPAIIQNQRKRVDDGERHSVILKREGRRGSIEIDNTWTQEGEAEGFTTAMNCYGNIYIGGTPNIPRMTGSRFAIGFNGCVHGFEVQNSQRLDLGIKAINGLNVKPCSSYLDNNIWDDNLVN